MYLYYVHCMSLISIYHATVVSTFNIAGGYEWYCNVACSACFCFQSELMCNKIDVWCTIYLCLLLFYSIPGYLHRFSHVPVILLYDYCFCV